MCVEQLGEREDVMQIKHSVCRESVPADGRIKLDVCPSCSSVPEEFFLQRPRGSSSL